MWVQYLGWKDPPEEEMATHPSILAWKILWMEEPGRLHSIGSQRVGHDWAHTHTVFITFLSSFWYLALIPIFKPKWIFSSFCNSIYRFIALIAWIGLLESIFFTMQVHSFSSQKVQSFAFPWIWIRVWFVWPTECGRTDGVSILSLGLKVLCVAFSLRDKPSKQKVSENTQPSADCLLIAKS